MKRVFYIIGIPLAFALHVAMSALLGRGWPPEPLVVCTIIVVWLQAPRVFAFTILPAAALLDLMQANHLPLVIANVLCAWGVTLFVQQRWLTNRSTASLIGLTSLGLLCTTIVTAIILWIAHLASLTSVGVSSWVTSLNLFILITEWAAAIFIGFLLHTVAKLLGRSFLYATH